MKRINAALGLLAALLLLAHLLMQADIYLTFSYLPVLSKVTAYGFLVPAAVHALLSVCLLAFGSGRLRPDPYPKLNRRTTLQRVTALGTFLLLPLHTHTFSLLQRSAGRLLPILALLLAELVFYALTLLHVGFSLSRGLISLGWVDSLEKQRRADRAIWIALALIGIAAAAAVVRGQLLMFAG